MIAWHTFLHACHAPFHACHASLPAWLHGYMTRLPPCTSPQVTEILEWEKLLVMSTKVGRSWKESAHES